MAQRTAPQISESTSGRLNPMFLFAFFQAKVAKKLEGVTRSHGHLHQATINKVTIVGRLWYTLHLDLLQKNETKSPVDSPDDRNKMDPHCDIFDETAQTNGAVFLLKRDTSLHHSQPPSSDPKPSCMARPLG